MQPEIAAATEDRDLSFERPGESPPGSYASPRHANQEKLLDITTILADPVSAHDGIGLDVLGECRLHEAVCAMPDVSIKPPVGH